ncbi:hypothetical protein D3C71_2122480 [compost metagenome]
MQGQHQLAFAMVVYGLLGVVVSDLDMQRHGGLGVQIRVIAAKQTREGGAACHVLAIICLFFYIQPRTGFVE